MMATLTFVFLDGLIISLLKYWSQPGEISVQDPKLNLRFWSDLFLYNQYT